MFHISEKEFQRKMELVKRENESKLRIQALREEKNKYRSKFKLPSTSKLMAVYLFIFFNVVAIYAMVAMWYFRDFTYLGVLITDLAAQALVYLIYSAKATKENVKGGISYDLAMLERTTLPSVVNIASDDSSQETVG